MKYIASISGGQDSTAMTVRLLELGMPLDYIIFCDTGNEFPQMYEYLDRLDKWLLKTYNIGITRLKGKNTLHDLCFTPFTKGKHKGDLRGMPFASGRSFCTRVLKKNVSDKFCRSLKDDITCYIGYVYHERKRIHKSDKSFITYKFPLVEWKWNEDKISNYLKTKTLYNNLYDHYTRTGCMFCPKQSLDSWYALYSNYPALFNEAKEWENQAIKHNAYIKHFRADYSLHDLEFRFEKKKKLENKQATFDLNWNDEQVSCMCG